MANVTIGGLTNSLTTPDDADLLEVEDVSVPDAKKITATNLRSYSNSVADGSASSPARTFVNDTNTGEYRVTTDTIGWTTGGTLRISLSTASLTSTLPILTADGSASAPSHSFSSDSGNGMYLSATDTLGWATNGVQRLTVSTTAVASSLDYTASGTTEYKYASARSTVVLLNMIDAHTIAESAVVSWHQRGTPTSQAGLKSAANSAYLKVPLHLPDASVVTLIRALVAPGAARSATNRVQFSVVEYTPNFGTPADPTGTSWFTAVEDNGGTSYQVLTSGAITKTIAKSKVYEVLIRSGSDGGTNRDVVVAIEVTFDDPGPRNY